AKEHDARHSRLDPDGWRDLAGELHRGQDLRTRPGSEV
ncbi:MAG: hypothetical protein AVDCRST_MAG43-174, partial [uncultured Thermomicrobiales bacterium]